MFCLLDIGSIVWVIGWFVLYSSLTLSAIYCAGYLIFKLIEIIRKELDR
jgi:hypothetical protein